MSISSLNSSELGLRAILQVPQEKDISFADTAILDRVSLMKGQKRKVDLSLCSHIKANSGMRHSFFILMHRLTALSRNTSSSQVSKSHVGNLCIGKGTIGT